MAKNDFDKINMKVHKTIAVWGGPGNGKSDFVTQISILLAQNTDLKILAADFNTVYPTLDHYFGIPKESDFAVKSLKSDDKAGLRLAYDFIERGNFDSNDLSKIVVEHPKYNNLHILTGVYDLSLFERMNENHFSTLIKEINKVYDLVLLDTNSLIFVDATYVSLKLADIVYVLLEADYTCLRETNRTLSYLNTHFPKSKFKMIVNKHTDKHLNKNAINKILEDYSVEQIINYNPKHINNKIIKRPFILDCSLKEKKPYVEIVKKIINEN